MLARVIVLVLLVAVATACGGGATPTTPATGGAPTQPPVVSGDAIDSAGVAAAVDALQAQESWRFEVTTITMGVDGGVRTSVMGTERTQPERAVDAQHFPPGGGAPFRYVRIGDDIWFDVGTGTFNQVAAAEAENLIEQYEPYYLAGLADSASAQDWVFELVGSEFINTIEADHYRLSADDLEDIVDATTLTPDQWGGDVWIAKDGGYMVQLAWGPQAPAHAQLSTGFFYDASDINCECPIEPPT